MTLEIRLLLGTYNLLTFSGSSSTFRFFFFFVPILLQAIQAGRSRGQEVLDGLHLALSRYLPCPELSPSGAPPPPKDSPLCQSLLGSTLLKANYLGRAPLCIHPPFYSTLPEKALMEIIKGHLKWRRKPEQGRESGRVPPACPDFGVQLLTRV